MKRVRAHFGWLKNPQLLIVAVSVCLFAGALGNIIRTTPLEPVGSYPHGFSPRVKGAATTVLSRCSVTPCIALTFDDGPNASTTSQILDILDAEHVHATFFLVGQRVKGNEALVRRMYRSGNEIGNHSWNHPDFTKLNQAQVTDQIQRTQGAIIAAGVPAPHLLRPPYGAVNPAILDQLHMTVVNWNVDSDDWHLTDPAKIDANVLNAAQPGRIILMHDIYPTTVTALRPAIDALKTKYQFVTVSQLMNLSPGDQGQYFGHY